MTEYIDTREGWREVSQHTFATARGPRLREDPSPDDNGLSRYWVRDALVPPLPTVPYTVIRVTWKDEVWEGQKDVNPVLMRQPVNADAQWAWGGDADPFGSSDNLARRITSFEVLSEPCAVTAKAVLEHVRREYNDDDATLRKIANEFGVES